jgi:hypothetical protein
LRDDVDEMRGGVVTLCGELIARDVNRFDLRLRRQLPSFEAVDAQHRIRRHVHNLPLHLIGIIR